MQLPTALAADIVTAATVSRLALMLSHLFLEPSVTLAADIVTGATVSRLAPLSCFFLEPAVASAASIVAAATVCGVTPLATQSTTRVLLEEAVNAKSMSAMIHWRQSVQSQHTK
jgi:hypothetical protein